LDVCILSHTWSSIHINTETRHGVTLDEAPAMEIFLDACVAIFDVTRAAGITDPTLACCAASWAFHLYDYDSSLDDISWSRKLTAARITRDTSLTVYNIAQIGVVSTSISTADATSTSVIVVVVVVVIIVVVVGISVSWVTFSLAVSLVSTGACDTLGTRSTALITVRHSASCWFVIFHALSFFGCTESFSAGYAFVSLFIALVTVSHIALCSCWCFAELLLFQFES